MDQDFTKLELKRYSERENNAQTGVPRIEPVDPEIGKIKRKKIEQKLFTTEANFNALSQTVCIR